MIFVKNKVLQLNYGISSKWEDCESIYSLKLSHCVFFNLTVKVDEVGFTVFEYEKEKKRREKNWE